jgi:hypothetical protein
VIALADGTHWANGLTAGGTIAVAIIAVGIAIWSERRTDLRVEAERKRSDRVLAEEREFADKRLADQQAHSDAQLAQERQAADARLKAQQKHSDGQLERQRRDAQAAEQLVEAWSIEVLGARMPPGDNVVSTPENPSERTVAIVVNRGRYTITRVQARFSPDGQSIADREQTQSFTDFSRLPHQLGHDLTGGIGEVYLGVIMPGAAMRFIGGAMLAQYMRTTYSIVRWTDRWSQRWEHKQGDVYQITEDTQWKP